MVERLSFEKKPLVNYLNLVNSWNCSISYDKFDEFSYVINASMNSQRPSFFKYFTIFIVQTFYIISALLTFR